MRIFFHLRKIILKREILHTSGARWNSLLDESAPLVPSPGAWAWFSQEGAFLFLSSQRKQCLHGEDDSGVKDPVRPGMVNVVYRAAVSGAGGSEPLPSLSHAKPIPQGRGGFFKCTWKTCITRQQQQQQQLCLDSKKYLHACNYPRSTLPWTFWVRRSHRI